jgi:hypothetical protein
MLVTGLPYRTAGVCAVLKPAAGHAAWVAVTAVAKRYQVTAGRSRGPHHQAMASRPVSGV